MTEVMYGLISEAKKNRFSSIPKLTEEDVVSVWDNVSQYIIRQMRLQKGVAIPGLGTFTFSQRKLDVGNNKYILIQRPVFVLSEKFSMTHGLSSPKLFTTGQIPVVQLNFTALSNETPFDRDNVESCVKEVLQALNRSIQAKRNVEFHFNGMGRLSFRDCKVKMKFYKDFIKSMDGSDTVVQALCNRPGTADSVISEAFFTPRPHTSNTLILPRIEPGTGLENTSQKQGMGTITEAEEKNEEGIPEKGENSGETNAKEAIRTVEMLMGEPQEDCVQVLVMSGENTFSRVLNLLEYENNGYTTHIIRDIHGQIDPLKLPEIPAKPPTRQSPSGGARTRSPLPTAKATAVSYGGPAEQPTTVKTPSRKKTPEALGNQRLETAPLEKMMETGGKLSPNDLLELPRSQSKPQLAKPASRMESRCSIHGARGGQELCYLCHQRAEKDVPVYMHEERRRKELEQDRLLQQYQHQKDSEAILNEQTKNLENRKYNQKVASFNLGVAEAVKEKKTARPLEFSRSYLFHNRALTPPRIIKQKEYSDHLSGQVTLKNDKLRRLAQEQEFLERLEQVQLAEDLAIQREQYLREKKIASDLYKKALDTQVMIRCQLGIEGVLDMPLSSVRPLKTKLSPYDDSLLLARKPGRRVRFKPLPIPALEPDSTGPIFGIYDSTEDKLDEQRRRAKNLYHDQLDMVAQKKRHAILTDLRNQKEESEMLERTKKDIIIDRSIRHQEQLEARRDLEKSWAQHVTNKQRREEDEKLRSLSPGMLIHEQCDKYNRCKQCGRRPQNCGESNVWSESRYIPGSRLIV